MRNKKTKPAKPETREPAYQKQTEDYKRPKVFVATPCYVGQVHVKYMESVMALQHLLTQHNVGFEFFNIPFDSLIPRARNASVTRFMASKDATHLLFVDADIQFHPMSVLKMLQENKGVICGVYPKKALDFDSLKHNFDRTSNHVELVQSSVRYAYNFVPGQQSHRIERGVVEVLDGPTGFMMIQKSVIRDMIRHYADTEYKNDVRAYQVSPDDRFYDLFQCRVFDGRYLSEDYSFCRLLQNINRKIFADLTVKLNHIGQFCYHGDPMVQLRCAKGVEMTLSTPSTPSTPSSSSEQPQPPPEAEPEAEPEPELEAEPEAEPEAEATEAAEAPELERSASRAQAVSEIAIF
eukprot:346620-Prorocentrum_minimum.AAC.1